MIDSEDSLKQEEISKKLAQAAAISFKSKIPDYDRVMNPKL